MQLDLISIRYIERLISGRTYLDDLPLPLFLPPAVILLVCISSPMYDCKNRFPPSSFSCSDFTLSTLSTICSRLSCNSLAWCINASLAVSSNRSTSSLVLRGDIVRASPGPYSSSVNSILGVSRGTIMVLLETRLRIFGRLSFSNFWSLRWAWSF